MILFYMSFAVWDDWQEILQFYLKVYFLDVLVFDGYCLAVIFLNPTKLEK